MSLDITNFTYELICDEKAKDTRIEAAFDEEGLKLYITAKTDRPRFVRVTSIIRTRPKA